MRTLQAHLPLGVKPLYTFKVVFHPERSRLFELNMRGKNAVLTKVHAMAYRLNKAFFWVKLQLEPIRHKISNQPPPLQQLGFAISQHYNIVHITNIIVDVQLPFGKMVNLILIDISQHLV